MQPNNEFDAIVVGSGTCGATLADELTRQNKKVLILERGSDAPLKEGLVGMATIADEVSVGHKLTAARAITTGGSTSLYFGVVNYPPPDAFSSLGIDLSAEMQAVKQELPIAPLPDHLIGEQAIKLRDSASALGIAWHKHDMLIDQSKCAGGYTHAALWRARQYVNDAVARGATLVSRATVQKVLIEKGRAVGVEYRLNKGMFSSATLHARGAKVIVAAGELASPKLLRDSGVQGVGKHGFYCNPGYAIYGLVPGMRGRDNFVGSMGCTLEEGIELGDANVPRFLHRLMMLSKFKLKHMVSYPETIGIGVKVKDEFGGEFRADGSFYKEFSKADHAKLRRGEQEAIRILKQAGAKDIFNFGLTCAGRVGGFVSLRDHLNENLETEYRDLHVCDGSVLPDAMRGTPTFTLVSLAKYLAKRLY